MKCFTRLPSLVIGYMVLTRRHLHSLFTISTTVAHVITGLNLSLLGVVLKLSNHFWGPQRTHM